MSIYKVFDKTTGKVEEVDAVSSKQAIFKSALDKTHIDDRKTKKKEAGKLYEAMLKSHQAILLNDPNQMNLFK